MHIYSKNRLHERISEKIEEDPEESFISICEAAPEGSVMGGVQRYGDTMLNEPQLKRFAEELNRLPEDQQTAVIRQVKELTQQALSCRGYLFISGD
ncbi:hypothetical protein ACFP1Z_03775 [Streptomyces gamaensis]|uniref:Uncharacterized protein n=1 Tax=Streptomyces gamaensis TaxID=1763542 RepID=A0ABW0YY31_9ACTN